MRDAPRRNEVKMKLTQIKKVKKELGEGKSLQDIIKDSSLDMRPMDLSDILVRKYGTDNIGNPLRKGNLKRQASRLMENALVDLSKAEVITILEELVAEANAS